MALYSRGSVKSPFRRVSLALSALLALACDPKPTTGAIVLNITGLPSGAPAERLRAPLLPHCLLSPGDGPDLTR